MPSIPFPSEIESCGDDVNIFYEELEKGDIPNSTGQNSENNAAIRSKNYIEVDKNEDYIFSRTIAEKVAGIRTYDKDKNYIKALPTVNVNEFITHFKTDNDTCYIRFVDWTNNFNNKYKLQKGTVATAYSPFRTR